MITSIASVDGAKQHHDELLLFARLIASLLLRWNQFVEEIDKVNEQSTFILSAPLYFKTSQQRNKSRTNRHNNINNNKSNCTKTKESITATKSAHEKYKQTREWAQEQCAIHCSTSAKQSTNNKTSFSHHLPRLSWLQWLTKRSSSCFSSMPRAVHKHRHVAHKLFDDSDEASLLLLSSSLSSPCCDGAVKQEKSTVLSSEAVNSIIADVECTIDGMNILQKEWVAMQSAPSKEVHFIELLLSECERLQQRYKELQRKVKQMPHEKENNYCREKQNGQHNMCTQTTASILCEERKHGTLPEKLSSLSSPLQSSLHTYNIKQKEEVTPMEKSKRNASTNVSEEKLEQYLLAEREILDNYYQKLQKEQESFWERERGQLIATFTKQYQKLTLSLWEKETYTLLAKYKLMEHDETNERLRIINNHQSELFDLLLSHNSELCLEVKNCKRENLLPFATSNVNKVKCTPRQLEQPHYHGNIKRSLVNPYQHTHAFLTFPRVPLTEYDALHDNNVIENDNVNDKDKDEEKREQEYEEEYEKKKEKEEAKLTVTTRAPSTEHSLNVSNKSKATTNTIKQEHSSHSHVPVSTSATTLTSFGVPVLYSVNDKHEQQPSELELLLSSSPPPPLPQESMLRSSAAVAHFPWQNETSSFTSLKAYCHARKLPSKSSLRTTSANHFHHAVTNRNNCNNNNVWRNKTPKNRSSKHSVNTLQSSDRYTTPRRPTRVVTPLLLSPADERFCNTSLDIEVVEGVRHCFKQADYNEHAINYSAPNLGKKKDAALETFNERKTASPALRLANIIHFEPHRLISPSPEHSLEQERYNDLEICNYDVSHRYKPKQECEEEEEDKEEMSILFGHNANLYIDGTNVDIIKILDSKLKHNS